MIVLKTLTKKDTGKNKMFDDNYKNMMLHLLDLDLKTYGIKALSRVMDMQKILNDAVAKFDETLKANDELQKKVQTYEDKLKAYNDDSVGVVK